MAITNEQLAALSDYAWGDIAKAAKVAMVQSALGGAVLTINGRTFQSISIEDAKTLYQLATDMAAAEQAGDAGMGNVLVNFNKY